MLRCDFLEEEGEGVKVLLGFRFDPVILQRFSTTAPVVAAY